MLHGKSRNSPCSFKFRQCIIFYYSMSTQSMTAKHELCGYGPVGEPVPRNALFEDPSKIFYWKKKCFKLNHK